MPIVLPIYPFDTLMQSARQSLVYNRMLCKAIVIANIRASLTDAF